MSGADAEICVYFLHRQGKGHKWPVLFTKKIIWCLHNVLFLLKPAGTIFLSFYGGAYETLEGK